MKDRACRATLATGRALWATVKEVSLVVALGFAVFAGVGGLTVSATLIARYLNLM